MREILSHEEVERIVFVSYVQPLYVDQLLARDAALRLALGLMGVN